MVDLHEFPELHFLGEVAIGLPDVESCQRPEAHECVLFNVGPVLLGKQIPIDPVLPATGEDQGSLLILVEALFEHAAFDVVGLAEHDLPDSGTELIIRDACLLLGFGEPGCFEDMTPAPQRSKRAAMVLLQIGTANVWSAARLQRGSLVEKTSLRKCIRPLDGD